MSKYHTSNLEGGYSKGDINLSTRNHGIPLEMIGEDITPTGAHYLLIHFDIPKMSSTNYQLEIKGLVNKPLTLSFTDIIKRPQVSLPVTMECAGNGRTLMNPRLNTSMPWDYNAVGTYIWTGTPLKDVLEDAGIDFSKNPKEILFTGKDKGVQGSEIQKYQRALTIEEVLKGDVLLVYMMNGQLLTPQHGAPMRIIVPGWYGMTSVKWLESIEVIDYHFKGYQHKSYALRKTVDEEGEEVKYIQVRALMVPPGFPDFASRKRFLESGNATIEGKAWAGKKQVVKVEISIDQGNWEEAVLHEPIGKYAWRPWSFNWNATPGKRKIRVRATDEEGNVQPDTTWNFGGFAGNMIQQVEVNVLSAEELQEGKKVKVSESIE